MNLAGNDRILKKANNYVTEDQINKHGWKPINSPAIFFAKVGAAVLLNRKRLVFCDFLLDNNTMAFSIDEKKLNTNFALTLFQKINLPSLVQVGALPSYNANQVEDIEIIQPNINEQMKIGKLFFELDSLITLHQRK